jgi:TetR/AcrR family transcriptional regulator
MPSAASRTLARPRPAQPARPFAGSAAAPPKHTRRKEARPAELLDAALELFVEKGFAATHVEEVAARAGVSKGTLFLYFPSKEDLFKEVVRRNIAGRIVEWNAQFESFEGSTAEMLRLAMRQWWEQLGATSASGIIKLVMGEARNFPEIAKFYQHEVIEPGHELMRRVLQRGIDQGEFRPVNLDYAIYSVIAPMIFLIMWKHSMAPCLDGHGPGAALDPLEYVRSQVDILLGGLVAPSPRPRRRSP